MFSAFGTPNPHHFTSNMFHFRIEISPLNSRELGRSTRGYCFMDIVRRQLRRVVDDQLREMYQHFVGQTIPPEIGQLLDGLARYISFESARPGQQHGDVE
jgi:hypothetical protein